MNRYQHNKTAENQPPNKPYVDRKALEESKIFKKKISENGNIVKK